LGGSLSLLLAVDLGNYLSRVDALNPAGLYDDPDEYDRWDDFQEKPQVVIQKQGNDPVSLLGTWKTDWQLVQVTPPENKQGNNPYFDHFLNYAGFAETEFSYPSTEEENAKRSLRNFIFYTIGKNFVYYLTVVPYNKIIHPLLQLLVNNRKDLLPWTIGTAFLMVITLIVLLPSSGLLIASALTITGASILTLSYLFIQHSLNLDNTQAKYAKLHDPKLPRNAAMDTYNLQNLIEIQLTRKQLNTYKQVMRDLVLINEELPLSDVTVECEEEVRTFKTTKATAVHVKHSLSIIEHMGKQDLGLKEALTHEYNQYCRGSFCN
jgi:hypothetical protein